MIAIINILSMMVKAPSNTKVPFNFISTALIATLTFDQGKDSISPVFPDFEYRGSLPFHLPPPQKRKYCKRLSISLLFHSH